MVTRIWLSSTIVVFAIVSLIVIAPLTGSSHPEIAKSIYGGFALFCHQIPERSYFIAGHKFAVCSRCTGLYAGFALTLLCYPLLRSLRATDWPPPVWIVLSAVPMAIDFGLTFLGIWENTHTSRLLTGLLLGGVSVFYVMPGLAELATRKTRETRPTFTLASPEHMAAAPSDYSAPDRRI
ncbi:MAG TPA: DUF2085 domain-containing protein [Pyrinomonadaceae bacterium]|nr:DUF2085 domain-containing protein [Pyrinomonadaceae bacterium]